MKKKLLLIIENCNNLEYWELMKIVKKENENVNQILIEMNSQLAYCYGNVDEINNSIA